MALVRRRLERDERPGGVGRGERAPRVPVVRQERESRLPDGATGRGVLRQRGRESLGGAGAINAGMSVYLYVESIEASGPAPDYNECALLP